MYLCPSRSTWTDTLFSYTTLVRSERRNGDSRRRESARAQIVVSARMIVPPIIVSLEIDGQPVCRSITETASDSAAVQIVDVVARDDVFAVADRKSTRLNSSH